MTSWDRVLLWLAVLLYAGGFIYALASVRLGRKHNHPALLLIVGGAFLVQTTGLYIRGQHAGGCPLGNPFEILQFVVWSCTFLYLLVGSVFRMSLLGFFTSGLAASLGILSLLVPAWDFPYPPRPLRAEAWIEAHAAFAAFSYGVFGLLALTSLMYLIQNRSLRRKHTGRISPLLPSIVQIDQMSFRLLSIGTALLTFALIVGMVYWSQLAAPITSAKLAAACLVWAGSATLLALRASRRLLAGRFAWACLALFLFALVSIWPVDAGHSAPPILLAPTTTEASP